MISEAAVITATDGRVDWSLAAVQWAPADGRCPIGWGGEGGGA